MTNGVRKWLGIVAASATVIINVVGVFINADEIKELKAKNETQDILIADMTKAFYEQDKSCSVLKEISSRNYTYRVCK